MARTALLATEGFTDLEELGRQARRRALPAVRGAPAAARARRSCASPVPERTGPDGVLRELDEEALRRALDGAARGRGGGRVPAVGLPPPRPRAAAPRRWREELRRTCTSRPRTRPPACSASTSAAPPRWSTPRCPRCCARYLRAAGRARRRRGPARARGDALERRRGRARRTAARHAVVDRALGSGRRRRGRGPRGRARRARATPCASTWAARPATCRWPSRAAAARERRARGRRPRAGAADGGRAHRRRRRRQRSRGATRAARCAWARDRRAPSPGPRATAAAASEPTVTDANLLLGYLDADVAAGRRRASWTATRPSGRVGALGDELGLSARRRRAAGIVRVAERRDGRARCAW